MLFARHEFALDLLLKMLKKVEDNSHPPQEQLRVIASFVHMMIDELRGTSLTMDVQALSASRQGHVFTIHARANEAVSHGNREQVRRNWRPNLARPTRNQTNREIVRSKPAPTSIEESRCSRM